MGVEIQWKWAATSDLSKLMGTLFGLHMELHNVDQSLVDKVKAKLKCWSSTHLSLACRTFIVNRMLMSSLWCFTTVWVGLKRVLVNIKALLRSYLWCGTKNMTRTWVSWDKCMIPKKIGGLSLTSLEDAMKALMSKWIIQAIMPDHANMQILVRCRITRLQPSYHDKWWAQIKMLLHFIDLSLVSTKSFTYLMSRLMFFVATQHTNAYSVLVITPKQPYMFIGYSHLLIS
jgi:hypothetical protein